MPALRKFSVVVLTVIALGAGTLLAGGAQGGNTGGHSGKGQYGAKPGCAAHKPKPKHKANGKAVASKKHHRRGCPKKPRKNR